MHIPSDFKGLLGWLGHRQQRSERETAMADWGPVVRAVVLFVLLTPGLLFQLRQ